MRKKFEPFYEELFRSVKSQKKEIRKQFIQQAIKALLYGRICYSSDADKIDIENYLDPIILRNYLNNLFNKKHTSVFSGMFFKIKKFRPSINVPGYYGEEINGMHLADMFIMKEINMLEFLGISAIYTEIDIKSYKDQFINISVVSGKYPVVIIKGLTRYSATQILRHKVFNFCQQSLRYTKLKNAVNFDVMKENFKEKKNKYFLLAKIFINLSVFSYKVMSKIAPAEISRNVLPLCAKTKLIMSGDAEFFGEFIEKRNGKDSQFEVRYIADTLKKILNGSLICRHEHIEIT